ncbi:MAG: hypothetical protein PUF78_02705, partial [Lachnospiraceae bacterium]|nr:hypothetical protein [Lachnospiraceae bacterium]
MGISRRNIYQAAAVLAVGAMLTAGAFRIPERESRMAQDTVASNGLAGVTAAIGVMQVSAGTETDKYAANLVASGKDGETSADTDQAKDDESSTKSSAVQYPEWANRLIANVDTSATVRNSASESGS